MAASFFRVQSRLKGQIDADRRASLLRTLAATEWQLLVEQSTLSRLCLSLPDVPSEKLC